MEMNELGGTVTVPTVYEMAAMSIEQLRSELARSLTRTTQNLRYLAAIWCELEGRGEDLSDLRTGLAIYLPQIASGELTADAVIRFAGQPSILKAISTLPADDQARMARGENVQILTVEDDGTYSALSVPATTLTPTQARLVVGVGKLRTIDEQRAQIESAKVARAARARPTALARVRYDSKTDKIRVGSTSATVAELLKAIADAAKSPEHDVELTKVWTVRLSESEHKGLAVRATQAGMTYQDYARMVLVMQNLLP